LLLLPLLLLLLLFCIAASQSGDTFQFSVSSIL
jgi:hypothetical protein